MCPTFLRFIMSIQIYTSYFAYVKNRSGLFDRSFSIANSEPTDCLGMRKIPRLNPPWEIVHLLKNSASFTFERFTRRYISEVLSTLDPEKMLKNIGHGSILVCWEGRFKNCHRHIVGQWLKDSTGCKVNEL